MKETFKYNSYINAGWFVFVYVVKTFVLWDLTNPFQYIIDLPLYTPDTRMMIFFNLMLWQAGQFFMIHAIRSSSKI